MYIMIPHTISEPTAFWNAADPSYISPQLKVHHTFPMPDGTRAVCIFEAASVDELRNGLEPLLGRMSRSEYLQVENKDGFAVPSRLPRAATAGASGR